MMALGSSSSRTAFSCRGEVMIVTPFYAGLLGLFFLLLSARVSLRRQSGTSLGDGGDASLLRVIRGHGNFAEYVPFILVMMVMLEIDHTSTYVLHALGIALLVGRLLHGYALSFTSRFKFGRITGTGLTWVVLAVSAVLCILKGLRGFALM
jgi:uncharacterized membrane protein YecN with MAPEG domain